MEKQKVDVRDLATDRWPEILAEAGIGDEFLQNKHGPCPACGGKDRYRFDNKDGRGTYFCSGCGFGDGFTLLEKVHGWHFKESANFIREFFGGTTTTLTVVPPKAPVDDKEEKAKIRRTLIWTWKGAKAVTPGDPVWKYLVQTRKLPLTKVPSGIRFHPGLKYFDEDMKEVGTFPVMLTVVRDAAGKAVGLHRTYLTSDGQKAPVNEPKKLMKTCGLHGGAIRLSRVGRKLAVAEGIETAFAVMAISKLPCWATVSATLMPNVVIPPEVEEVTIFADNDIPDKKGRRAGQDAAKALAERLRAEGKKVQVVIPSQPGTDFHDVYLQRQDEAARKAQKKKTGLRPAAAKAA